MSHEIKPSHHVAIPTSLKLLIDLGAGRLRTSKIMGQFSQTMEVYTVDETIFTVKKRAVRDFTTARWGTVKAPYKDAVSLKDIYAVTGELILSELAVQIPREETVVTNGVPKIFISPVLFHFEKWPFQPGYTTKILDKMPSGRFWKQLKKIREKATDDKEILKRLRATLLVNKPPRANVTLNEYRAWFSEFAMILPETIDTFRGRELG